MRLNNYTKAEVVTIILSVLLIISVVIGHGFDWAMWCIYLTAGCLGATLGALVATKKNKK